MSAVDALFMITAGLLAVIGIICFVVGLIMKTPLKWVFVVILILGIYGKTCLPHDVYVQAKEEGIIWLTVLHSGDIEAARREHNEGAQAIKKYLNEEPKRIEETPRFVFDD